MARIRITRNNLTQDLIKKLITYNPKTGIITRNELPEEMMCCFSAPRFFNEWNEKAGEEMGVVNIHKKKFNYKTVQLWLLGSSYTASRLIWLYMAGGWPEHHIDHINGDSTDNRWCNLRDVTCQENLRNQKIRKNNKSGKTGVDWNKTHGSWQARGSIVQNGKYKRIFLGYFGDLDDAIEARIEWEQSEGNFTERHRKIKPVNTSGGSIRP